LASGGPVTPATRFEPNDATTIHRWPSFLPDGRHYLFFVRRSDRSGPTNEVWLGSLDSWDARPLVQGSSNAIYTDAGYILFVREGSLFALPFDARSLRAVGSALPLVQQVRYQSYRWYGVFSAARTGLLLYQGGSVAENSELVWFDRSGRPVGSAFSPAEYAGLRLSPDGRHCAVEIRSDRNGTIDIWLGDLSRRITTRLTSGPGINDSPVWSPDGSRIAFASNRSGKWGIYEIPARESGQVGSFLESDEDKSPTDWSSDGRRIAFISSGPKTGYRWNIQSLSPGNGGVGPLVRNSFNETSGRFSPDGRLLAYTGDETGREEIYVQELTGDRRRWRISTGGGAQPVWRRDGRELFYVAPDDKLMAVSWRADAAEVPTPTALFQTGIRSSSSDIPLYDVSPDGNRFLINTSAEKERSIPLTLVVNWTADVKK
jgi:WD40 repeat protein